MSDPFFGLFLVISEVDTEHVCRVLSIPSDPFQELHLIYIYFRCLLVNPHVQAVQNVCVKGG